MTKVIIFGSTGTAGSGAVRACLDSDEVTEVRAVTRRSLGFTHDKLVEVKCRDFADLNPIAAHFEELDACLYCLGVSVRQVSGEDEYRKIHEAFPRAALDMLKAKSPEATFVYLSGQGAKRTSRMMWARVKAEAEDSLHAAGDARLVSVRPGGIVPMAPTGFMRWMGPPLLKVLPSMGIGAYGLGQAMLHIGLDGQSYVEKRVVENIELRGLAAESAG